MALEPRVGKSIVIHDNLIVEDVVSHNLNTNIIAANESFLTLSSRKSIRARRVNG